MIYAEREIKTMIYNITRTFIQIFSIVNVAINLLNANHGKKDLMINYSDVT